MQVGFDVERTFLFKDTDAIHDLYPNVLRIQVGPSFFYFSIGERAERVGWGGKGSKGRMGGTGLQG